MEGCSKLSFNSTATYYMTPEMGLLVGQALAKDRSVVVVGVDYMRSSLMMKNALISGLLSSGTDVIDVGYIPAPVITEAAKMGDCAVYVTEGEDYGLVSGFIITDSEGNLFDAEELEKLNWIVHLCPQQSKPMEVGKLKRMNGFIETYTRRMVKAFECSIDCALILDCSYGSCSLCAPQILDMLGAEVTTLNAQRDRNHDLDREDVKDSGLRTIKRFIESTPGTIGMFLNRMGTKIRLVDEQHENVPSGILEALITMFLKPEKVVVPFDETGLVEDALFGRIKSKKRNAPIDMETPYPEPDSKEIVYCRPGIENICGMMRDTGASIGFYKGSVIFSKISLFPDGIKTAVVLGHIASLNSVHNIIDEMELYERSSASVGIDCDFKEFKKCFDDYAAKTYQDVKQFNDGWRIGMNMGWAAVIRSANDLSVLDIIAESKDHTYLVGLLEMIKTDVRTCMSGISQ